MEAAGEICEVWMICNYLFRPCCFNCLQYSIYLTCSSLSFISCLFFGTLNFQSFEHLRISSSNYMGRRRCRFVSLIPQAYHGLFYSVGKPMPRSDLFTDSEVNSDAFSGRSLSSFQPKAAQDKSRNNASFRHEGHSRLSSGSITNLHTY